MLVQAQYVASLADGPGPSAQGQLTALLAAVALAESASLSPATPSSELPLRLPASYWLDLRTYHPTTTAAGLTIAMFFSQGGRDYQVPPSELTAWRTDLVGHPNATFKTYPAMDHLLLTGSGRAMPAECGMPGRVDLQLVADLAAWVRSR